MARAWTIFREQYGYPQIPFRSIGRHCFVHSLKLAWAEYRQERQQVEFFAALPDADLFAEIARMEREIASLTYAPWGIDIQKKRRGIEARLSRWIAERDRRATEFPMAA